MMEAHNKIPFVYTEEVKDALNEKAPIVALESNVITHGLPYPNNIETAKIIEESVRKGGSIPATIGISNGNIHIGMSLLQIEEFATSKKIPKVSNRDIAVILAKKEKGATTVASSVKIAELAKIKFFASAGIGGVHRGAEKTMDISADLFQFTNSKVVTVCAGAKNILDLGLTLEYLETYGVPVISYQSDDFPAFYCKSSNFKSPHRFNTFEEIIEFIKMHWILGNTNSILITKSINDKDAINEKEIESILKKAIQNAENENISGNALTKYLMHFIDKETNGKTSVANKSVLISTAEFAGKLAFEYYAKNKLYKL